MNIFHISNTNVLCLHTCWILIEFHIDIFGSRQNSKENLKTLCKEFIIKTIRINVFYCNLFSGISDACTIPLRYGACPHNYNCEVVDNKPQCQYVEYPYSIRAHYIYETP